MDCHWNNSVCKYYVCWANRVNRPIGLGDVMTPQNDENGYSIEGMDFPNK